MRRELGESLDMMGDREGEIRLRDKRAKDAENKLELQVQPEN